jgi:hypothetical protein
VTNQPQSIEFALSSLKDALREVIPHEDVERNVLLGEHYLISSEEHQGLVWNKITKTLGAQALGALTVAAAEKLEVSAFKKVNIIKWCRHSKFMFVYPISILLLNIITRPSEAIWRSNPSMKSLVLPRMLGR